MSIEIHPSSVVSPKADLADGVVIGPFCVVEEDARIGRGTRLRSHVVVGPHTEIGEDNVLYPHCAVGMDPQDLKYQGGATRLVVGNRNTIRENCTLHRGTEHGGGITRIGDDNLMQVGAHMGHDCQVGSQCILAHQSSLAGHVSVGDGAIIGAYSAVHQFCRVGNHAFTGAYTVLTMDVLPFMKTVGTREVKSYGVNTLGLQRKGFPQETIEALSHAHRVLFRRQLRLEEALQKLDEEGAGKVPEVAYLLQFIREAERGIHRG
ncbi:acyl-ACP--UDP-N-acetylglucosamine O-acyltransferase [Holophaga foetida]|uniref:acyl-ACP--UDP-N-acetylglucosamine O-acyltransferase n=1 Tax=Holophaga foetida TaxID=35839 RepID=UPI0002474A14|nr:acyl-ACP--UDP-N-acetylglucosamine O-acyltransferase [Holophaga foetida]